MSNPYGLAARETETPERVIELRQDPGLAIDAGRLLGFLVLCLVVEMEAGRFERGRLAGFLDELDRLFNSSHCYTSSITNCMFGFAASNASRIRSAVYIVSNRMTDAGYLNPLGVV